MFKQWSITLGLKQWHHDICRQWLELEKILLSEVTQTQNGKHGMFSLCPSNHHWDVYYS